MDPSPPQVPVDLLEYKRRKAKAGGTGGGDGGGTSSRRFKAGESTPCRIMAVAPRGYKVSVFGVACPAFLRTDAKIELGTEIMVQFVCVYQAAYLFTPIWGQPFA